MRVWVHDRRTSERDYRQIVIEDLGEIIHEMAAVAWDRDVADVSLQACYRPLRFMWSMHDRWVALTGEVGGRWKQVAWWDPEVIRWVPGHYSPKRAL